MKHQPILVIGSTGKTGGRIIRRLVDKGFSVRHGSRSAKIPFDWDDEQTWSAALADVKAAYVSYFPDLAFPGAEQKIAHLTEFASCAGVERLVLLSGRGEHHAERCEEIVRQCGLEFTLIRASWFAQNFSEGYLYSQVLDGVVALPAGDVLEPIVDVDDIADVSVAALTEDGHVGQLYEVTGSELLGFADVAAMLSDVLQQRIIYQPISLDQFHASLVGIGGPMVADVFTEIARETLDGRNESLGDGVQRALGREPRHFTTFCHDAQMSGAWHKAA